MKNTKKDNQEIGKTAWKLNELPSLICTWAISKELACRRTYLHLLILWAFLWQVFGKASSRHVNYIYAPKKNIYIMTKWRKSVHLNPLVDRASYPIQHTYVLGDNIWHPNDLITGSMRRGWLIEIHKYLHACKNVQITQIYIFGKIKVSRSFQWLFDITNFNEKNNNYP